MNLRKGISPVIATVIIVAVALAIAIAVVGWIMGIWGAVTGGTEMLKIYPDSYISSDTSGNPILYLHVENTGGATAVIYKIEVSNITISMATPQSLSPGIHTTLSITLTSVSDQTTYKAAITPGALYTVKIYTKAGNVYTVQVQAK